MRAIAVEHTWVLERRVLRVHPRPLPAGDGDVVDCADVARGELIVAVCEVAVGQRIMAVRLEPLGVPDLVCHDLGARDAQWVEKKPERGVAKSQGTGSRSWTSRAIRETVSREGSSHRVILTVPYALGHIT